MPWWARRVVVHVRRMDWPLEVCVLVLDTLFACSFDSYAMPCEDTSPLEGGMMSRYVTVSIRCALHVGENGTKNGAHLAIL